MHNIILQELILYIDGNKSRLKCLVGMVIPIAIINTVCLSSLYT
ncbi:hypothetical protein [Rickettsia endosymbiont of Oedothorax gibbosus]|nr:hypothetical protein [Rickettsia endosymbiont of Oedothorax gibbosus]